MAYLPLSTANLPDPVIDPAQGSSPEDYFNTVLYTGNNNNGQAVTGVGFQPDFVWIKQRTTAVGHNLEDAVRGAGKFLQSETNATEDPTGNLVSFDSDGFTVGTGNRVDQGTNAYVAWNWKAGTSFSNSADANGADIASSGSINTTSGFSIISYTGSGTTGDKVAHGLGVAPEMVIVKGRTNSGFWMTYHKDLTSGKNLALNETNAENAWGQGIVNATDANTFTLTSGGSGDDNVNDTGDNYIAYCFHSVEGFSKFGSYTGNGSTDGPFVYTGFRPAFVLVKANANEPWWMMDSSRDSYNVMSKELVADGSDSEYDRTNAYLDFLSNGFKLRNNDGWHNNSGVTHIYMAFAENPFKYSNAR